MSDIPNTPMPAAGKGLTLDDTIAIPDSVTGKFMPWIVDVNVYMTAASNTNFNALFVHAGGLSVYGAAKESSTAQNDEINFNVMLAMGTWTFELMHVQANNRGIYTVTLIPAGSSDSISVGTVDGYAAAATYNVRSSLAGIVIPKTGLYTMKLKMATKNAASTNYQGSMQHIQWKRTA